MIKTGFSCWGITPWLEPPCCLSHRSSYFCFLLVPSSSPCVCICSPAGQGDMFGSFFGLKPCSQSQTPQLESAEGRPLGDARPPPWTTSLAQAGPALMAQEEKEGKPYLYRWPATLPSIPKLSATLPPPDSTHIACGHWVRQLLLRGIQVKHSIKAAL